MDAINKLKQQIMSHNSTWMVHYYPPAVFQGNSRGNGNNSNKTKDLSTMDMAIHSQGSLGLASLVSLLIAMEAKYYLLTSGSNWSRLIDELRLSVTDPACGGCTRMVDLREGIPSAHNW